MRGRYDVTGAEEGSCPWHLPTVPPKGKARAPRVGILPGNREGGLKGSLAAHVGFSLLKMGVAGGGRTWVSGGW